MDDDNWEDARSILDQMSSQEIQPVLIDFGGLAYYSCSMPLKSLSIDPPNQYDDVPTLERDINAAILFDNKKTAAYFKQWRAKSQVERFGRYQDYFNTWVRHYNYRVQKKERETKQEMTIFKEWRILVCESKLRKFDYKLSVKRAFRFWKAEHKDIEISSKFTKKVAVLKRRAFFKKWKLKTSRKLSQNKRNAVIEKHQRMILNKTFSFWTEKYYMHTRHLRTDYFLKKLMLDRWKKVFARSQSLSAREVQAVYEVNNNRMKKFLCLWRRRARIVMKKRARRVTNTWEQFATRLVDFYKCKQVTAKYCEKRIFAKMKETIGRKNKVIENICFQGWKQLVYTSRKAKAVQMNRNKWTLYRFFGKWRITWRAVTDVRLMTTVQELVVNVHLKQEFFGRWVQRATDSVTNKQDSAIELRRTLLKTKILRAWHYYTEMLQIRAEEHYRKTLLEGSFAIFIHGTIGNSRENEEKAREFRERKLKQKYMRKFRYLLPSPQDMDLTDLITILNSGDPRYTFL